MTKTKVMVCAVALKAAMKATSVESQEIVHVMELQTLITFFTRFLSSSS